ncbi:MAG TPA: SIMPL domain-containing protein [Thermaerobacter sp.]|jgi:uncharacterized protein YggE
MRRLAVLLPLLLPATAQAQEQPRWEPTARTVTVTATGTAERPPDQALLSLAVESTGRTAQAASQANAEKMEALVSALRRAGIPGDRIRTTSYQLHPEYATPRPGSDREPEITGYRAMNMVQVEIDQIDRVGAVIDAAIGTGANRIAGLQFRLRDPEPARREALRNATLAARAQAEALASAAGQRLGPLLALSTGPITPPPRPFMAAEARALAVDVASTPIEPGTLTMTATVSAVYQLEAP